MGVECGSRMSSVMVRHVPLQAMLSPSFASERIVGHEVTVIDVPPPPVAEGSRAIKDDMTADCQ